MNNTTSPNLNEALKSAAVALQAKLGLTSQNNLAKHLGYAPGYVSMVINGKTQATKQFKNKLVTAGANPDILKNCPTCGQPPPSSNGSNAPDHSQTSEASSQAPTEHAATAAPYPDTGS